MHTKRSMGARLIPHHGKLGDGQRCPGRRVESARGAVGALGETRPRVRLRVEAARRGVREQRGVARAGEMCRQEAPGRNGVPGTLRRPSRESARAPRPRAERADEAVSRTSRCTGVSEHGDRADRFESRESRRRLPRAAVSRRAAWSRSAGQLRSAGPG